MLQDSASLQDVVTRPSPEIAAPQDAENSPRSQGVTLRVTILCLLLACLFGYVIPIIDVRLQNTFLGAAHLPPGAIAVLLFVLLLLNPILRVLGTRFMLSRNETLTVYISCLFSCLVPGHGSENFFIGSLVAPFYYAKPENKWLDFLVPYLKPWFTPALNAGGGKYNDAGRSVVDAWYTGVRPGETIPFSAWILPLALWGAFVFASYIMLGCLGVMLRAQWGEKEALAFPLLRLPMEMTEDVDAPLKHGVLGRFFKSPTMWVGFGIAVFVQLMNGLNLYFPDVPQIPLSINTSSLFTEAPWNQMGGLVMNVFPIVVGVTYLLTAEVSLSLWFFYLFIKLQLIVAYMTGFLPSTLPNPVGFAGVTPKSFTMYQTVGAVPGLRRDCDVDGTRTFQAHLQTRHRTRCEYSRRAKRSDVVSVRVLGLRFVVSFPGRLELCRRHELVGRAGAVADVSRHRAGADARYRRGRTFVRAARLDAARHLRADFQFRPRKMAGAQQHRAGNLHPDRHDDRFARVSAAEFRAKFQAGQRPRHQRAQADLADFRRHRDHDGDGLLHERDAWLQERRPVAQFVVRGRGRAGAGQQLEKK